MAKCVFEKLSMAKICLIVQMVNFKGGGGTDHLTIAFV